MGEHPFIQRIPLECVDHSVDGYRPSPLFYDAARYQGIIARLGYYDYGVERSACAGVRPYRAGTGRVGADRPGLVGPQRSDRPPADSRADGIPPLSELP